MGLSQHLLFPPKLGQRELLDKLAATSAVNRVDGKEKGYEQRVALPGPGCNNTAALEEWTNFPAASSFGSGQR